PDIADLASAPPPGTSPGGDAARDGADLAGSAGRPPADPDRAVAARSSMWPHIEEHVVDLVLGHDSTLVFTNSRRGAERLTARLNGAWARRLGLDVAGPGTVRTAAVPGQSGSAAALPEQLDGVLAKAHHGSMSRAERTRTEEQ